MKRVGSVELYLWVATSGLHECMDDGWHHTGSRPVPTVLGFSWLLGIFRISWLG